jgi:acyl-coenzyme A synthetase/AMP-(fatty) acid ligase
LRSRLPGTSIFLMYGLTEAFRSTYLPPEQADRRPTSMGKAIPNAEVLVLRPDGTECGPGEPGELVHRGALVSLGYWKDPERTAERFKPVPVLNGRLPFAETAVWSGDTVVKDDEGYLYFVGREDEMIKTSGYRVSPTEIEEVVYGSGLVAEAVAVGVPHAVLGQAVVLLAVAAGGADPDPTARLLDALKPKLPGYMLPCRVHWRRALPRNANGKIDRAGLAAECRQGRGDCADE